MSKALLTIIFSFLAILLLFLILPKRQELNDMESALRIKELELQMREDYFLNLRQSYQTLKEHEQALEKIETALPQEPEFERLLSFLAKTAEENGLLLAEVDAIVTHPPLEPEKAIRETTFSARVLGDYFSFKNFLKSLERSARLIVIERISLFPKNGLYEFELEIRVYSH